jgi:SAM-dependent methyltransferase
MYSPTELIFLTECITSVSAVPGSFLEVGCAYGATTVFLNKFMKEKNIRRNYYAIDTFAGFAKDHVTYEMKQRKKSSIIEHHLRSTFRDNNKQWFDKMMALHDIEDVITLEKDASRWDFSGLGPIAFCLIDVDLYIPVKESLSNIYRMMSPGGIVIVDDCWNVEAWDGALQAYEEFVTSKRIPREIVGQKLGIIRAV